MYDSGIGGLSVLNELKKTLPNEDYVYFADTANMPYGNKSRDQIINYSRKIILFFQNEIKAKLVVAACHTSSAVALENIAHEFYTPIIGTINPIMKHMKSGYKRVGVIATQASIESGMHKQIISQMKNPPEVVSVACPDFVPLIERKS